ncbi:MAG: hypothetical protein RR923_02885 [Bacilli bacterium]
MFSYTIKNKYKNKKINEIIKKLPTTVRLGMIDVGNNVKELIVNAVPIDTGRLKESISVTIQSLADNKTQTRIFSDITIAEYGIWVNYGTGLYAEGEGGSKRSSDQIPWVYFNESKGKFFSTKGIKATHFFDDKGFLSRQGNINLINEKIKEMLHEFSVK